MHATVIGLYHFTYSATESTPYGKHVYWYEASKIIIMCQRLFADNAVVLVHSIE